MEIRSQKYKTYALFFLLYLIEPFTLQPLAQHVTDTSQVSDGLLSHGLGHKVPELEGIY